MRIKLRMQYILLILVFIESTKMLLKRQGVTAHRPSTIR